MLRRHRLLAGIVLAGLLVRVAYVLATRDWALRGDEIEYAAEGRFFAAGHPWWSALPYGIPHPSLWKAPAYPAWVGAWFSVLGPSLTLMRLAQALASCVTIVLTWALGRRLWGESVGLAGAAVVAVHPFAWDYDVGLFPEVFATPLTLLVLLLVLERPAGPRRAAVVGALVGVSLLIRPTAGLLLAPVLVALALRLGLRRGVALTALAGVSAALVLAPWAYRNHRVAGGFVPVSIQDSALYGTFNDDAAHDRTYPWAWRPVTRRDLDLFRRAQPLGDVALRSRLLQRARSYIADHPASLADAFFWNGLSRLWDVRRPARVLEDAQINGRSRPLTAIALALHWILLPLALLGLWRARRRPALVWPLVALALAAAVVFSTAAATRYRVPFEPVIALLAASGVFTGWRRSADPPAPGARRAARG